MNIKLNGQMIITRANNLKELLKEQQFDINCVATAFNGIFIPKSNYAKQCLEEGCQIEVLSPMQGG